MPLITTLALSSCSIVGNKDVSTKLKMHPITVLSLQQDRIIQETAKETLLILTMGGYYLYIAVTMALLPVIMPLLFWQDVIRMMEVKHGRKKKSFLKMKEA